MNDSPSAYWASFASKPSSFCIILERPDAFLRRWLITRANRG
ncbi:MAG: hypothetical protein R2710_24105 [Acidimicrobiales bacterium]